MVKVEDTPGEFALIFGLGAERNWKTEVIPLIELIDPRYIAGRSKILPMNDYNSAGKHYPALTSGAQRLIFDSYYYTSNTLATISPGLLNNTSHTYL